MKGKTQYGLLFLIIGLIISLISGLIVSTSYFFIDEYQTVASNVGFLFLYLIVAVLIITGGILFLIGSMEFGVKHRKNVIYALIIFIANIFFTTILTSAIVYVFVSGLAYSAKSSSPILIFSLLITSVVSSILTGLMYYFALIELEDEKGKRFLFAGIISLICVSIIQSVYIFGSISSFSGSQFFTSFQSSGSIGVLSIIPGILFLFALYIPYYRIKEGKLKPQDLQAYTPTYTSNAPVRFCPNCGRGIPMDAHFCSYCGKNFDNQNLKEFKTIEEKNDDKKTYDRNEKIKFDVVVEKVKGICPKCNKKFESEKMINDDGSISATCNNCKAKLRMKK